ncbi:MAG TPA: carboxypeptidase regulatory-like domain-containing protein [Vicinamibacterales bacterium]|nr:carboxypeptidase regulatory-like domain-containing protein [Vicinamibacterales bacterium]
MQWKAVARKQDGSREDVTTRAVWTVDRPEVASVASDGRVTGRTGGAVSIQAAFGLRSDVRAALVLPKNSFVLTGLINQSSFGVPDATVRVESASIGTGLSVKTDDEGRFALYGVAGSVELRITKQDYRSIVQTVNVSADQSIELEIETTADLPRVSGSYMVTFSIAGCTELPQALRTRTYRATVTTKDDTLRVRLSGAHFVGQLSAFSIGMLANEFAFHITAYTDFYYGTYVEVLEQVTPSQTVAVFGTGYGTGTPERISAQLDGGFWMNPLDVDGGTRCPGQVAVSMVRQ